LKIGFAVVFIYLYFLVPVLKNAIEILIVTKHVNILHKKRHNVWNKVTSKLRM